MSHYRIKTEYHEEGSYGSVDRRTLYAHHNMSCDYVAFYDDNGDCLFEVPSTLDNNLIDAINRLYNAFDSNGKLNNDIEYSNSDELEKLKML